MNIFVLSSDVDECAKLHCDKHVVKMIVEYAQLLSTAHRLLDGTQVTEKSKSGRNVKRWILSDSRNSLIYNATHYNHPCAVWTRQSSENYKWLVKLFSNLLAEYEHRYKKIHATSRLLNTLSDLPNNIQIGDITEFTQCMPKEYHSFDPVIAYRLFYINEKKNFAKYTDRQYPDFLLY